MIEQDAVRVHGEIFHKIYRALKRQGTLVIVQSTLDSTRVVKRVVADLIEKELFQRKCEVVKHKRGVFESYINWADVEEVLRQIATTSSLETSSKVLKELERRTQRKENYSRSFYKYQEYWVVLLKRDGRAPTAKVLS